MDEDVEEQIEDMKIQRFPMQMAMESEESSDEADEEENPTQLRYKAKYVRLKRQIKELMFENASLCDEVSDVAEKVDLYKEQRLLLLKRLLIHDKDLEKQYLQYQTQYGGAENDAPPPEVKVAPQKRKYRKRSVGGDGVGKAPKVTARKVKTEKKAAPIGLSSGGQPVCPFIVDGFTVHCLGEVNFSKSGYHTSDFIYPVGYSISRVYGHFKDPERKCVYTCRVLDNGEFPRFEIVAVESEPKFRISGPSPDYCHTTLLRYINNVNGRNVDIRPQGESFFGLSNPTIASFVGRLPNAEKCARYAPRREMQLKVPKRETTDASLNYDALQRHMNLSTYHDIPEIKEEPPEDLFDISDVGGFKF